MNKATMAININRARLFSFYVLNHLTTNAEQINWFVMRETFVVKGLKQMHGIAGVYWLNTIRKSGDESA